MIRIFAKHYYFFSKLYWFIFRPHTRGVKAICIDTKGGILLVWHTYIDGWFLPGGGVNRNESFEEALKRELSEELGSVEFFYKPCYIDAIFI